MAVEQWWSSQQYTQKICQAHQVYGVFSASYFVDTKLSTLYECMWPTTTCPPQRERDERERCVNTHETCFKRASSIPLHCVAKSDLSCRKHCHSSRITFWIIWARHQFWTLPCQQHCWLAVACPHHHSYTWICLKVIFLSPACPKSRLEKQVPHVSLGQMSTSSVASFFPQIRGKWSPLSQVTDIIRKGEG